MNAQDIEAIISESLKRWPIRLQFPVQGLTGTPALDNAVALLKAQQATYASGMDEARLLAVIQRVEDIHHGQGIPITRRELSRLAWAFDHGSGQPLHARACFSTALGLFQPPMRPRILLGLIEGYWRTSCRDEQRLGEWALLIARGLEGLTSDKSEVLAHWRKWSGLLFAPGRIDRLATWLWETRDPRTRLASLWPDPEEIPRLGHRLVQEGLEAACRGLPFGADGPDLDAIEILVTWLENLIQDVHQDRFWLKQALEIVLVRLAEVNHVEPIRSLLSLVTHLFNDPRLTAGHYWGDIDPRATQLVMIWLPKRDLEFFFRALALSMDPQRHAFWMNYVDQITYTRLVIGADVYLDPAYRAEFKKQDMEGRYAQMKGNSQLAALIIKIGKLTIVEFSQSGNAAYWYLEPLPIDLHARHYSVSDLKIPMRYIGPRTPRGGYTIQNYLTGAYWQRYSVASGAKNRLMHTGDWCADVARFLAQLGIQNTGTTASIHNTLSQAPKVKADAKNWQTQTIPSAQDNRKQVENPTAVANGTSSSDTRSGAKADAASHSSQRPSLSAFSDPLDGALDVIVQEMRLNGLEVVDKRNVGGMCWFVAGPTVKNFMTRLELLGLKPRFSENGGAATGYRPAYYVNVR